ncbi:MAG: hypothetical protein ACXWN4_07505 [Candidatus Limnocylindrales bacterium]
MGARTDAARAEVVAQRQVVLDEVVRLEAAARSAVDIPAKIRRAPARTAALLAGTAFMALGGPKRAYRAIRHAVLGPKADLPKSMLPEQIDKALGSLGDDGDRVRGLIEREFVGYLEKNKPVREARDLRGTISELGGNVLRPVTAQAGKRLAAELFSPRGGGFAEAMKRIQARRDAHEGAADAGPASAGDADSSGGRREPRRGRGRNVLRPR